MSGASIKIALVVSMVLAAFLVAAVNDATAAGQSSQQGVSGKQKVQTEQQQVGGSVKPNTPVTGQASQARPQTLQFKIGRFFIGH